MKRKHIILLIVGLLLISGLFAIRIYNKWHYKKYKANIEHNHDVMKYFVDDSVSFVRTAFAHLETHFTNPNDFNLNTYSIRSRDTIVNGTVDTIYSIYFTYFVTNNNEEKFSVLTGCNLNLLQKKSVPAGVCSCAGHCACWLATLRQTGTNTKQSQLLLHL